MSNKNILHVDYINVNDMNMYIESTTCSSNSKQHQRRKKIYRKIYTV